MVFSPSANDVISHSQVMKAPSDSSEPGGGGGSSLAGEPWLCRGGMCHALSAVTEGAVSLPSLARMFICISFVNVIGQMVWNYFNCLHALPRAVRNVPKCLFTNGVSSCEFWFATPTPSSPVGPSRGC